MKLVADLERKKSGSIAALGLLSINSAFMGQLLRRLSENDAFKSCMSCIHLPSFAHYICFLAQFSPVAFNSLEYFKTCPEHSPTI